MAKFQVELTYLGASTGKSKKTGNEYMLPKFMDMGAMQIFEFYLPNDKLAMVQKVVALKPMSPCAVTLEMTSFNNKPQVDLYDVEQ